MDRQRQKDLLPEEALRRAQVTIVGAGAVGSATAIALAKMGIGTLTVYDFDTVAEHNLPNQWYRGQDIGLLKVEALRNAVVGYSDDTAFTAYPTRYDGRPIFGIAIAAVDSMDARHFLWRRIKRQPPELYIDSRMGPELSQIFSLCRLRQESWADFERRRMIPPGTEEPLPCTAKSTIYGAMGTAALICASVRRHLIGEPPIGALVMDWVTGFSMTEPY